MVQWYIGTISRPSAWCSSTCKEYLKVKNQLKEVVFAFFATTTCNLSKNPTSLKEYTVLDPLCFGNWHNMAKQGQTMARGF